MPSRNATTSGQQLQKPKDTSHDTIPKGLTVGEVEKLRPGNELIKCYHNLCRVTGQTFDPNMWYEKLPHFLLREGQKLALREAFIDIARGTDLWTASGIHI